METPQRKLLPPLRSDPVEVISEALAFALIFLGDTKIKAPKTDRAPLLLLMELREIFREFCYSSFIGKKEPYEYIWDNNIKFGKAIHRAMFDATQKYFPHKSREELLEIGLTVINALVHDQREIPSSVHRKSFIKFFRQMNVVAKGFKPARVS